MLDVHEKYLMAPGSREYGALLECCCPLLGLADDAATHALWANEAHRCAARYRGRPILLEHQLRFCLSEGHVDCPLFAARSAVPSERQVAPAAPHRDAASGGDGSAKRRLSVLFGVMRRLQLAAGIALVSLVAMAAFAVLFGSLGGWLGHIRVAGSNSTSSSAAAPAAPPAVASLNANVTSPAGADTQSAVTVPPPGNSAPPATSNVTLYTVQPGDGLWQVSAHFGIPLQALAKANDIAPTALLEINQVLRIPADGAVTATASP